MEIFGGMGCVTNNSCLGFDGDPEHDMDTGIFKGIFTVVG